jgi:GGDEF domain-containing protein
MTLPPNRLIEAAEPSLPRTAAPPNVPRLDDTNAIVDRIERHVARARRAHAPLALLAVALGPVSTIDGHPAPEHAPALALELTRRLRGRVRLLDDLWRWGDDEWIAVLPGCRAEGARNARQRLVAALAAPYRLDAGLLCTVPRIGLACLGGDAGDAAGLLAGAQAALDFDDAASANRRAG